MSYWYERISKKNTLILVTSIPVLMFSNGCQLLATYCLGCVPTASRVLYDWISPERSENSGEAYPYVSLHFDTGCTEWLGFSTCEAVQFKDWMPIWMQAEAGTMHLINVTEVTQDMRSIKTSEIRPTIKIGYSYSDDGTTASLGQLVLKRNLNYQHDVDASRLGEIITTLNPKAVGLSAIVSYRLSDVLGLTNAGDQLVYLDLKGGKQQEETFRLPSPTHKQLGARSLYYYSSIRQDDWRCGFDDDCAEQGCTWKGKCEPQGLGYGGIVLPSSTFFFEWKSLFGFGQWPTVPWSYATFCVQEEVSCAQSKTIIIFHSSALSRATFQNTRVATSEKFPDLSFFWWTHQQHVRHDDTPSNYTFVSEHLFLSLPTVTGDAGTPSMIYSERTTGLRMDYQIVWQMNSRVLIQESNGQKEYLFVPLYWVEHRPVMYKLDERLEFASLNEYGESLEWITLISFFMFAVANAGFLITFFKGISCLDYWKAADIRNLPNVATYY